MYYRRDHTFDVKTCFQQNRYVFDVIVTSWALFVFCISWNFARDIWTVFEEIKHLRSRAPEKYLTIIKINKTQILWKYFLVSRDVKFLEKRRENVLIFQALRWRFDIWEAIFVVQNDGMSARNSYIYKCKMKIK